MCVVQSYRGPWGPYMGPHTSWDPVAGSHIFVGLDGGLVGFVGSVRGSTHMCKGYGESLKGVDPSRIRRTGPTPIYKGCGES